MNREIKFRVWNGMEMVYDVMAGKFGVFYVNPGVKGDGLDEKDSASLTPFNTKYHEHIPVMQFTGLLDKNGKEIYEGDRLKGIIQVEADEQQTSRGNFGRKKNFEAIVEIRYSEELASFIAYTEQTNKYMSGFMRGCGDTRAQRAANHYRELTQKVKVETKQLPSFEVIGNIYEHPELVQGNNNL